ncbi:MAG: sulfite exporter TauE/SafE family protein [Halobacteriovoraceae bacterium]|jgi:uncharacterized protein|nr:sulfite exporter TauE/SafE family protein [Halobacteriovoraceae bacterium]MBT5093915.1 sulfite exporter TauE/SafE family protein [Halobacteriovoraceae bacterium]
MLLILIIIGLAVGVFSAFFGVGGGVILVPTLYALFPRMVPQAVIPCSLGVIFLNSCLNTYNFAKDGRKPSLKLVTPLGIFIVLGIFLGGNLAQQLSPRVIKMIFGGMLALVAAKTLFTKTKKIELENWQLETNPRVLFLCSLAAFFGGMIAGLTGLGGGIIIVPLLITVIGMPFKWVPAYSNATMAIGTFAGLCTYALATPENIMIPDFPLAEQLQWGYWNVGISLLIFSGAIFTSKLGVRLSGQVSQLAAKRLFAALLITVSAKIFYTTLL